MRRGSLGGRMYRASRTNRYCISSLPYYFPRRTALEKLQMVSGNRAGLSRHVAKRWDALTTNRPSLCSVASRLPIVSRTLSPLLRPAARLLRIVELECFWKSRPTCDRERKEWGMNYAIDANK